VRNNGIELDKTKWNGLKYAPSSRIAVEAFDLNVRLVLAMQQIGGGGSEAMVTGGMLDLCPLALQPKFSTKEQDLCLIQRKVGLERLEENVELEKRFSEIDDGGEIGINVSGDTRWDKRGTGSKYNLDSGCHLITGNMTKRVLAACPLS
jgi:hypothetical protein